MTTCVCDTGFGMNLSCPVHSSTPEISTPKSREAPTCHHCRDVICEERVNTEPTAWGTDGWTKYGRHVFEGLESRYWHCPKCGDEYLDRDQIRDSERKLNEAIKAKLGIDWLAENAERRKNRKRRNPDAV